MCNPAATRREWERGISRYALEFLPNRDRTVENMKFPPMAQIYAGMLRDGKSLPPTQRAFADLVLSQVNVSDYAAEAARARIYRAYTANVQQQHFGLVLAERFDRVEWDAHLDLVHGIDLVVEVDSHKVGFAVSVQTERADYFKNRKAAHYDYPPFPVLDVKIQPRKYTCGRFWLYDPSDADELNAFVELQVTA